jgi:hypothetical protein
MTLQELEALMAEVEPTLRIVYTSTETYATPWCDELLQGFVLIMSAEEVTLEEFSAAAGEWLRFNRKFWSPADMRAVVLSRRQAERQAARERNLAQIVREQAEAEQKRSEERMREVYGTPEPTRDQIRERFIQQTGTDPLAFANGQLADSKRMPSGHRSRRASTTASVPGSAPAQSDPCIDLEVSEEGAMELREGEEA